MIECSGCRMTKRLNTHQLTHFPITARLWPRAAPASAPPSTSAGRPAPAGARCASSRTCTPRRRKKKEKKESKGKKRKKKIGGRTKKRKKKEEERGNKCFEINVVAIFPVIIFLLRFALCWLKIWPAWEGKKGQTA